MRIGFTILYNGMHHLEHNGFSEFMASTFDYWIVIEGLAGAGGSTAWCRNLPLPARSTDGSHEYMEAFSKQHNNVIYYSPGVVWYSKDMMVNEAVNIVKMITDNCFLWQVDADEIWAVEDLHKAERDLFESGHVAGGFQYDHYLCKTDDGRQLVGKGVWGDGYNIRLFNWCGQKFLSHEPPKLELQRSVASLTQRYDHYSYYFEQDVLFKSKYYQGHEFVYKNWLLMKRFTGEFPQPISMLFGRTSRRWSNKKSFIDILKPKLLCRQEDVAVELNDHAHQKSHVSQLLLNH